MSQSASVLAVCGTDPQVELPQRESPFQASETLYTNVKELLLTSSDLTMIITVSVS
jgi:hypothetical protein